MSAGIKNYGLVNGQEQLDALIDKIIELGQPFGLDIETGYSGPDRDGVSLHPDDPDSMVVGISFAGDTTWGRYVPLAHDFAPQNFEPVAAARSFWRLLQTGNAVIHNWSFELRFLSRWFVQHLGAEVVGDGYFPCLADSMLESYLYAGTASHGLKFLTKEYFGHEQAEITSLFERRAEETGAKKAPKSKFKALRFNSLDLSSDVVNYCCEDAVWCLALHELFYPHVQGMFLYQVEHKIVPLLCRMEDWGVQYDWVAMRRKAIEANEFLEKLNAEIQVDLTAMTGKPQNVNIGSPQQLVKVLYEELGFKTNRKTDKGAYSTDEQALTGLSKQYPVVQKILDWKQLRKLNGTYLDKYEREYDYALDGRTHPHHMQTTVGAGRFAVSDPPYQQSPKKYHIDLVEASAAHHKHELDHGDECKCEAPEYAPPEGSEFLCNFRKFIVAPPGHYILGFDFSQVELRMLAGASQEPALMRAFNDDSDVHAATAALLFGKPLDHVSKEDRDKGKTLNFALLYGMGTNSLAERLAVTKDEAERLNSLYFAAYTNIQNWSDNIQQKGREQGFVHTMFGRKVVIWEFTKSENWMIAKGERLCLNAPIQGAAADYMKIAMLRADAKLREAGLLDRVHLVMNIHDALEYYVEDGIEPSTVVDLLADAVTFPVEGLPKIRADWHIGQSWGSLTELKVIDGHLVKTDEAPQTERYAPDNAEAVTTHQSAAVPASSELPAVPGLGVGPSDLLVELATPPTQDQLLHFLQYLQSHPGDNLIRLQFPGGDVPFSAYRTSSTPADQPQLALIFGAAMVSWQSVSAEALTAGLSL